MLKHTLYDRTVDLKASNYASKEQITHIYAPDLIPNWLTANVFSC